MREEGNSHQPDSESYAGEKPGQDATQRSAELGEDLGRASEVRTVRTAGFSPARKLSLERRKLFFLSAQESGTEASSGRARLGSARVTHAGDPKGVSGEVPGGPGVIILQLRRLGK